MVATIFVIRGAVFNVWTDRLDSGTKPRIDEFPLPPGTFAAALENKIEYLPLRETREEIRVASRCMIGVGRKPHVEVGSSSDSTMQERKSCLIKGVYRAENVASEYRVISRGNELKYRV